MANLFIKVLILSQSFSQFIFALNRDFDLTFAYTSDVFCGQFKKQNA